MFIITLRGRPYYVPAQHSNRYEIKSCVELFCKFGNLNHIIKYLISVTM